METEDMEAPRNDCPTLPVLLDAMDTPSLFDQPHPSIEGALAAVEADQPSHIDGRERAQLRIRQLNEDRLARQDDEQRLGRRRAAVARLRRRMAAADEVDYDYWLQRRETLQLVT